MALARLKAVAGVTIPDSALCNAAVTCRKQPDPDRTANHAGRPI